MKNVKKKSIDEFRTFLIEYIGNLKDILYIDEYKIRLAVETKDEELSEGSPDLVEAKIHVDTVYLSCYLIVYPTMYHKYRRGEVDDVKHVILHELCHILTAKQKSLIECSRNGELVTPREADYINENVTEKLTRILSKLLWQK